MNRYLRAVRERIAEFHENQSPFSGEIEVDEIFLGALGKTIVFGILKLNGKVHMKIVPDCSKAVLQAVIRGKVTFDSIIYSDG